MLAANLRISTHWPGISFDKNSLPKSQPTPFRFPPLSQAKMIGMHHQNVISSLFFPTKIKGSTHTSTNLPGEVLLLGAGKSTFKKLQWFHWCCLLVFLWEKSPETSGNLLQLEKVGWKLKLLEISLGACCSSCSRSRPNLNFSESWLAKDRCEKPSKMLPNKMSQTSFKHDSNMLQHQTKACSESTVCI